MLFNLKRFEEAEPLLREVLKHEPERAMADETRFNLAASLAGMGRRDEAKSLFTELLTQGGRFASSSRDQLAALEANGQVAEAAKGSATTTGVRANPAAGTAPARRVDPAASPAAPAP